MNVIYEVNPDSQANVCKDYYENHVFYMVLRPKSPIFGPQDHLNLSPIDRTLNSASNGIIYEVNPDSQANVCKDYYEDYVFYMVFRGKPPIFGLQDPLNLSPIDRA